jgi:hypothetical protein
MLVAGSLPLALVVLQWSLVALEERLPLLPQEWYAPPNSPAAFPALPPWPSTYRALLE